MSDERRAHLRYTREGVVEFERGGTCFRGDLQNIGFGGCVFATEVKPIVGQRGTVRLDIMNLSLIIAGEARVVRIDGTNAVIEFAARPAALAQIIPWLPNRSGQPQFKLNPAVAHTFLRRARKSYCCAGTCKAATG
jgi:hypothetical protein